MKKVFLLVILGLLMGGCATVPSSYVSLRDSIEEIKVKQAEQDLVIRSIIGTQQIMMQEMQQQGPKNSW
jgi:PBP1b-binding outer membrane lipoprotein LpoB